MKYKTFNKVYNHNEITVKFYENPKDFMFRSRGLSGSYETVLRVVVTESNDIVLGGLAN